jgi:hypothetical protein
MMLLKIISDEWVTKELNGFNNRATRAPKKDEKRDSLCMIDDDIDDCDCERLREDCTVLRTEYNEMNKTLRRPSKLT